MCKGVYEFTAAKHNNLRFNGETEYIWVHISKCCTVDVRAETSTHVIIQFVPITYHFFISQYPCYLFVDSTAFVFKRCSHTETDPNQNPLLKLTQNLVSMCFITLLPALKDKKIIFCTIILVMILNLIQSINLNVLF